LVTAGTAPRPHGHWLVPACSHDEFSPLKEIIVGRAAGARIPPLIGDRSAWLNLYGDLPEADLATIQAGSISPRVIEETEQDLQRLVDTLEGLGVVVHRPRPADHGRRFTTPDWETSGFYSYCPRDLTLILGSAIIQTPAPMRSRYFELDALREVFTGYMKAGSAWIAAPAPRLADEMFPIGADGLPMLGESEPAFDAANVLRCGRDLFYLVSGSGNELGLRWLETTVSLLGDYAVHPVRGVYRYTHIDSTIALLRPGLVLLNPERITESAIPAPLKGWDRIWCPPMAGPGIATADRPLSSPWIGMNLLMVSPELAIVDAAQHALIRELQRHRIEVLPLSLRHARALGGGFHCVTLDTVRDTLAEDYLA
jgi:glycine amidinotransferase/scyllo-inosamine-4-phosphate amidinotransferase 1